jgi:type III secretion protein L
MDMVVLIDSPNFKLLSTSRLIKSTTASAVVDAADLVKHARDYHALAEEKSNDVYEEARKKGLNKGLEEASAQMSEQLAKVISARQVALNDLGPMLASIVTDVVRSILKDANVDQVYASALEAVSGLTKKAQWVELRVHPEHVNYAQTAVNMLTVGVVSMPAITVVSDTALNTYDCIFQTDVGIADASLDVQLESIRAVIKSAVTSGSTSLQSQLLEGGEFETQKAREKTESFQQ